MAEVEACHDGYLGAAPAALHRRRLVLDRRARALEVLDSVEGAAPVDARLAFCLHPDVRCDLHGHVAALSWEGGDGQGRRAATLTLPPEMRWAAHRGETGPILGWYSARFGHKEPTTLLLGQGRLAPGQVLRSRIAFVPAAGRARHDAAAGATLQHESAQDA